MVSSLVDMYLSLLLLSCIVVHYRETRKQMCFHLQVCTFYTFSHKSQITSNECKSFVQNVRKNKEMETRHFSPFHQDRTIVCLKLLIVKTILILTKVSNFSKQALFIRGWDGWHVGNGRFWVSSRILKRIIGFTSHPKGLLSVQSVMVLRASPRPWQTHF